MRPCTLKAIGMYQTTNVLPAAMIHNFMFVIFVQAAVRRPFISHNMSTCSYTFVYDRLQRFTSRIFNRYNINIILSLHDTEHRNFILRTTTTFASAFLSTDISFISFS